MKEKVRVNITVDKDTLEKARKKLHFFGGKLSTLFNAYLRDFVDSIDHKGSSIKELEKRIEKLEVAVKN